MKLWVLDCSLAMSFFLPDESSDLSDLLFEGLGKKHLAIVPALWWYEVNNVLLVAERRKRLGEEQIQEIISIFESMPISMDFSASFDNFRRIMGLAKRYQLSVYDAAYLELAERKSAGLASGDKKLVSAAHDAGIKVFGG